MLVISHKAASDQAIQQKQHYYLWLKTEASNEGKVIGTVMVDFRTAFDLVDHNSTKARVL